ncbi:MAG: hypothetical protein ACYSVY_22055 [Planctomycetota bacterium]|jgi:hypothetical protein
MVFIELTNSRTGRPIAIAVDTIGEVQDNERQGHPKYGRTILVHRERRSCKWQVEEYYPVVRQRIHDAGSPFYGRVKVRAVETLTGGGSHE